MSVRRRGSRRGPAHLDDGFTLVEILVTIVLLGILAGIAIPTMLRVRARAQDRAAQVELRQALNAARQYYVVNERYTSDEPAMRAFQPGVDWRASRGINDRMTTAADVGRVHFEIDGPDFLVLGTPSGSNRCFYLYSRRVAGVERLYYATAPTSAACRDPWDFRSSTNTSW